jgi:hypothetical protein
MSFDPFLIKTEKRLILYKNEFKDLDKFIKKCYN